MKRGLMTAAKVLLCLVCALALMYAGRVLALKIMSVLFVNTGMSAVNYAQAPDWLRFVWDNADGMADAAALAVSLCGLLYLRTLFPHEKIPLMGSHLFLGVMGAFVGFMLVRLLESVDCVRSSGSFSFEVLPCITDWLICTVSAMLIRECVCAELGSKAACAVSALCEAVLFTWLAGSLSAVAVLNGLVTGGILALIFTRQKTIFPEVFICAGFRTGARRLAGFPGRIYTVSENWLSGGAGGLEASVLLTLVFALVAALFFLIHRKVKSNVQ